MMKFLFSKVFLLNLLAAILLICLLVWGVFLFMGSYTMHGESVSVPKLQGMTFNEAKKFMKDKPFQIQISDSVYKKGMKPGLILSQYPPMKAQVKKGRKIFLTINYMVTPHIAMPNLINLSLRQAKSVIQSYGFNLGKLSYRPSICSNCVLQQLIDGIKVDSGKLVLKNATIDLVIGSGKSQSKTLIPYLINSTLAQAKSKLNGAVLTIGAVNYDESVKTKEDSMDAKVFRQSPVRSEDVAVQLGSSVNVWLTKDSTKIQFNPPVITTDSGKVSN